MVDNEEALENRITQLTQQIDLLQAPAQVVRVHVVEPVVVLPAQESLFPAI